MARKEPTPMDELTAIFDAWDKASGDGRDDAATRELSRNYVKAHPDEFVDVRSIDEDACIRLIDVYRAAEIPEQVNRVQVWMWAAFPKKIIGDATVTATLEPTAVK